jgi:hypothetical protein
VEMTCIRYLVWSRGCVKHAAIAAPAPPSQNGCFDFLNGAMFGKVRALSGLSLGSAHITVREHVASTGWVCDAGVKIIGKRCEQAGRSISLSRIVGSQV